MTNIICRIDQSNKPVVFIADSLTESGEILAWHSGATKPEKVTYEYYRKSRPVAASDAEKIRRNYVAATHEQDVSIRARLPRQYQPLVNFEAIEKEIPAQIEEKRTGEGRRAEDKLDKRKLSKQLAASILEILEREI